MECTPDRLNESATSLHRRWLTAAFGYFIVILAAIAAPPAWSAYSTTLYYTPGAPNANLYDIRSMVQASDGNLYGAAVLGGTVNPTCTSGCGGVYGVTPAGAFSTVHGFSGTDGYAPAGLILGPDGNLYGWTETNTFKVTLPSPYTFTALNSTPLWQMVLGTDGNFYGFAAGMSFARMSPSGTLTILHTFSTTEGPPTTLIAGRDGNFYGLTQPNGNVGSTGMIFQATPAGVITPLASISTSQFDDSRGMALCCQTSDNNVWGYFTFSPNSATIAPGSVFTISPSGSMVTVHTFSTSDGYDVSSLTLGSDGNVYGSGAGVSGNVVAPSATFKITPSGTFTTLFSNSAGSPYAVGLFEPAVLNSALNVIYGYNTDALAVLSLGSSTGADLSLTGTSSESISGVVTYSLSVSNAGPLTATGTVVQVAIPSGAALVAGSSSSSCSQSSGQVICAEGSLASGNSLPISIAFQLATPGSVTETIYSSSAISDPNPSNNNITSTVAPVTASLSIQGGGSLISGSAKYSLILSNVGPQTATGVAVTATLPPGVSSVTGSSSAGCAQSGQVLTCSLSAIASGGSVSLVVALVGTADATITFTASTSGDYNPNSANDVITVSAFPPGGPTDGPIPLWAYLAVGLAFVLIGQFRLRRTTAA